MFLVICRKNLLFFTNALRTWLWSLWSFATCFIWIATFYSAKGQNYEVQIHTVEKSVTLPDGLISIQRSFSNSNEALDFIQQMVPNLQEQGYLSASLDSVGVQGNLYQAYLFLGMKYRWAKLDFSHISGGLLVEAGIKPDQWQGRMVRPKAIAAVSEKILQWAENNGYPFARVKLEVVNMEINGGIDGKFILERDDLEHFDSISIEGGLKINRNFLLRYIDIKQGQPYDERKLKSLSTRLKELPFLQESAPWVMKFKPSENILSFSLREKKANQLNALIGLLPNSSATGKFLLTIDAQFAFQNILGQGESIGITYQNLQYKSPKLKVDFTYPFLFGTPFSADLHFDLYKQDTSFRRTTLDAGVLYQLSATNHLRIFYHNQSNRLITADTGFVKANKRLPDNIDVSAQGVGLEMGWNKTDYRISPRRGWELKAKGSALLRKVKPNDAITSLKDATSFDFSKIYDSLLRQQQQYLVGLQANVYFSLAKKVVLKTAYNGGWIGGESLFRNELYQIGGFRLLRGFDEQSIFTNHYHVVSIELRLLMDANSFFYLFSDNGWVQTKFSTFSNSDIYNGFGMGASLITKSGLFSVGYALGRNNTNPIQFRQSKIHFGYVAYF
ncbi:MAG: BamA/TamA family outer membrane protein [Bacteroidetes bacterium]|nr:BamA/TamA family outer membrane protein [Bacteroidota bacterium]